jgi:RNA polymerase sigma-70 factor (ECF subfamily)
MKLEEVGALPRPPPGSDAVIAPDDDDRTASPALDAPRYARFRAMFDAHYDAIYRLVRRAGLDADGAEDGAQQVFLVAMRRIDDIEAGKERAFLCATAARIGARLREQHARARRAPLDDEEDGAEADGGEAAHPRPDELVDQKRRRELLDAILAEMEEDLRVALVLAEIEGLGKREIAEALGVPEGTAASRVRRAREEFEARVKRYLAARRRT